MLRYLLLVGVSIFFAETCRADEPRIPAKAPPVQALASVAADGKFTVRTHVFEYKLVEKKVIAEGKEELLKFYVPVSTESVSVIEAQHMDVFDTKGKKVDRKSIAARLKKKPHVLLSTWGPVDPFYLQIVKDDTLILVDNTPVATDPPKIVPK